MEPYKASLTFPSIFFPFFHHDCRFTGKPVRRIVINAAYTLKLNYIVKDNRAAGGGITGLRSSVMLALMVAGFLLHQASFAALTGQVALIDGVLAGLITTPQLRQQAWFSLEIIGGLLTIFGLTLYVKFIVSSEVKRFKPAEVKVEAPKEALRMPTCRFCGAVMESGSVFCPVCGKSQV